MNTNEPVTSASPRSLYAENGLSLASSSLQRKQNSYVLLNVATVFLTDNSGIRKPYTAVLDSASQNSYICTEAAQSLNIKKQKIHIAVTGLGDNFAGNIKTKIATRLSNEDNTEGWELDLLIIPKICKEIPSVRLDFIKDKIPPGIKLAKNDFYIPNKVDLLIGAQLFFHLLESDRIYLDNTELCLQSSCFGYLISGAIQLPPAPYTDFDTNHCFLSSIETLNDTLNSFWKLEEVNDNELTQSDELKYCDKLFADTHYRTPEGRYVVSLPFKKDENGETLELGDSRNMATRRLNQLWARLDKNPQLKALYVDFINEYESLNHMKEIKDESSINEGYFLPHHCILRPDSVSTKIRCVFDGSAKSTNGRSLNDIQYKGGVIQEDLFSIMLRFRKHIYAFTTDIKKMFRQVLVNPAETIYQKILWKPSSDAKIKTFSLSTVTYGTISASYLSTKVLQQLAVDDGHKYPVAAPVLLQDVYMDDCLSGTSTLPEFHKLTDQLNKLLQCAQMEWHKWCTNVDTSDIPPGTFSFNTNNDSNITKTLGTYWDCKSDTFKYKVQIGTTKNITKRDVLSQIARTYDVLGLISPVIAKAKILMQKIWLTKVGWHEPLPPDIVSEWCNFLNDLPEIEKLEIPRCVSQRNCNIFIINGFSDSSEKCYGAATYLQTISVNKGVSSHLLASKSKVAPLKTLTIPRLELQACVLLSKLVNKVVTSLKLEISEVRLFTDSAIALAWIKTQPHLLKVFVSNRVSEIQRLTSGYKWYHIPSKMNPADLVSRGVEPAALIKDHLWWNGPDCVLCENFDSQLPNNTCFNKTIQSEFKPSSLDISLLSKDSDIFIDSLLIITNNFTKLTNILSFIYRFLFNIRNKYGKKMGPLSHEERQNAMSTLVKMSQVKYFASELAALKKGQPVHTKSKLKNLNPFLDKVNLIRVGGRLSNCDLPYDRKHPILLPATCQLTKMIFQHIHKRDLHPGPQALLCSVRQTYWPINGRNIARQTVHNCVQCFKAKPILVDQLMGDLPPARINPSPPFSNSGIDLCGPFQIKFKNQRKGTLQKTYVVIFVCMATRAVHFETVSDLSADTLIAALKRFFSRHGKCATILSDNATNFSGADTELKRLLNQTYTTNSDIPNFLASEGVQWKFIPARSPNFGGIWEAGVKSFKYHLKRTIGSTILTLEEFLTVTIQIEGILNSRPLAPLSNDANDFSVLTPGHFLIGRPLNAHPEPDLTHLKENLLGRWQLVQKFVQAIWKAWSNNYLSHLQQRNKWMVTKKNIMPGMLVLIKDEQLPTTKWSTGRITAVIPGKDGCIRVAHVRTSKGEVKRAISNFAILPINDCN